MNRLLSMLGHKIKELVQYPLFILEDILSIVRNITNINLQSAFLKTRADGYRLAGYYWKVFYPTFDGWALTKSSLRYFCGEFFKAPAHTSIFELGSGASTIFWKNLMEGNDLGIKVVSLEHDVDWHRKVTADLGETRQASVCLSELRCLRQDKRDLIFGNPDQAEANFYQNSDTVRADVAKTTQIDNFFYDIRALGSSLSKIDGLIVDGPHGGGRSLAFPLLYKFIHAGTVILIDDFDDYPFLSDLSRIFKFKIVKQSIPGLSLKRWIIVKIL
ncbi:MAG: hypothetical protein WC863_01900 [Patescibacteria group bacterium]